MWLRSKEGFSYDLPRNLCPQVYWGENYFWVLLTQLAARKRGLSHKEWRAEGEGSKGNSGLISRRLSDAEHMPGVLSIWKQENPREAQVLPWNIWGRERWLPISKVWYKLRFVSTEGSNQENRNHINVLNREINKRTKEVTKSTIRSKYQGLRNKEKRQGLCIPRSTEERSCGHWPAGTGISGAWRRNFRELWLRAWLEQVFLRVRDETASECVRKSLEAGMDCHSVG